MAIPTLMPAPRQSFVDNNGIPLANGMVFTFSAGTSEMLAAFQDPEGLIPHENPIRLDIRGEATIYWLGNYKVDVRNSLGIQLPGYPVDNFNAFDISDSVAAGLADLSGATGAGKIGYKQDATGAMLLNVQKVLNETVSYERFGADPTGLTDSTAAIQRAYDSGATTGKIPIAGYGKYLVTSTVDAKGLPLVGRGRGHSTILCNVGSGVRTFSNVGQVVENLHFLGPGGTAKPDAFSVDGYKRYIRGNYFEKLGDAICSTAIFVTTVISQNEFISCESAVNDKLQDGTNAHTTLWFTDNNVLYCSKAFDMRTEAAGFVVARNVFEDLFVIYEGNGKQIFGSLFSGNWVEQMARSVTLFSNTFSGGTNVFQNNSLRPGAWAILDAFKWNAAQLLNTGDAAGGGGGLSLGVEGVRATDFTGNGVILNKDGLKPAALNANFSNAADITIATQVANSNQASRGGDLIIAPGAGSLSQRKGALRPVTDVSVQLGAVDFRWEKVWTSYIKASGAGGYVAATQPFHEFCNNQANGITAAFYNSDVSVNTVCVQAEFAGASGGVTGTGNLYLGKNASTIVFKVLANGNVQNASNSYGAISDIKYKKDVKDATPALADLMKLRFVNYRLKSDPSVKMLGLLADDVKKVWPSMVDEVADYDDEGNDRGTTSLSVKYSILALKTSKALQELKTEFDAYRKLHP